MKTFFQILILVTFSGCSSPSCVIPLDIPCEALEEAIQDTSDAPLFDTNRAIPEDWWTLFDDPQLTECIEKTFAQNPTLQTARAQIVAASYNAAGVRAALYPYLNFGADVSRQKLSKTGVIPFESGTPESGAPSVDVPIMPGTPGGIPVYFPLYETELNLQYTFDFWDKNRNTLQAVLGQVQASIAEEAFARLQLGTVVAAVYYELQINYERQKIAQACVDNRLRYLNLVEQRVKANLDDELAVQAAKSSLSDAKDLLLQVEGDIKVNEYQLMAYMAGNFDEKIVPCQLVQKPLPKIPLPEDLPLHLIAQRPDITAQLWLIQSAGRQIEVAKAGFYPDFNITAFVGFQTIDFPQLFKWPSRYFNVDPAVTLPLFDGGQLVANLRGSEVHYDLAVLEYNRLVINAAKEALDAITTLYKAWERLQEVERKVNYQSELYQLTSLRVSHSLGNSLDELSSEESLLITQHQEVATLGKNIQALLTLIKALGGGYNNCL